MIHEEDYPLRKRVSILHIAYRLLLCLGLGYELSK